MEDKKIKAVKKQPRPKIPYPELIDNIAELLASGYSYREINKLYDWAPSYPTMLAWSLNDPYASHKWREARTTGLEERQRDRIVELTNTSLDEIAETVNNKDHLAPRIREQLFKAKVDHVYKQIELAYKELAIDFPEKYGAKSFQTVTQRGAFEKKLTLPELQENLRILLDQVEAQKDALLGAVAKPEDNKGAH